ncbi:MAG: DUF6279 family lipoprotein [Noviherbaspirillum sp.]
MQNFITRPRAAFSSRAALFLLALLLAGCSALRMGYANGDTFVYWWLNGYVDFNDDQKSWVKADIDKFFAWHRTTQLKDYAQLLATIQQRVQHNRVTPAEVQADFAVARKSTLLVFEKALPELTDLALSLQSRQIVYIERKFASNNEKYRRENLTGTLEDRQLVRFKKVMTQAEYWLGDFNAEQEKRIRAASDARPLDNELWLGERMRRQQEMIRMLKKIHAERPAREAVTAMLKEYITRSFENFTYAEHKAFFDASSDGMAQMVAAIVDTATPTQRAHAVKRAQKWINDAQALAAQEQ